MGIYFSSDFHFHHKNIVRGTSTWTSDGGSHSAQSTRPFDTLEEHDETLVKNINDTVGMDDTLYFLGDWSFGGFPQIKLFRDQLNCRRIHFIYGNHDHHVENNKRHAGLWQDGVQKLFTSCQHYKEVKVEGQRIILSHYAMRVWNKSHHGSWMLYGHSHGSLPVYGEYALGLDFTGYKTMDVGIDTHPEFRPYSFEEIKEIMDKRHILQVDHHNETTN